MGSFRQCQVVKKRHSRSLSLIDNWHCKFTSSNGVGGPLRNPHRRAVGAGADGPLPPPILAGGLAAIVFGHLCNGPASKRERSNRAGLTNPRTQAHRDGPFLRHNSSSPTPKAPPRSPAQPI